MIIQIKNKAVVLATLIAIGVPASVLAQYVGPSNQKAAPSVADILKHPVDDQEVVLRGFLLKKVGNEKYIFSDGTGEIRVEIDAKDFPAQKIDDKTRVDIRGEVEKDLLEKPEIDVMAISITKQ